jgi:LmbE family N-acetylglucosaminyl deacetylase
LSDPLPLDELAALADRPRRLLAVFPHPDDESYGFAGTLCRCGDDPDAAAVLMTLTRGEAAVAGLERGLTPEQQAAERTERMERVAEIVGLDRLILGDAPDRRMSFVDPRPVERDMAAVMQAYRPNVVVSFGPRGINSHPDHIATHHIVKRAVLEARDQSDNGLPRFAMLTVPASVAEGIPRLLFSTPDDEVDFVLDVAPWAERKERCLRLHEAYVTVIGPETKDRILRPPIEYLRLWGEAAEGRPLADLFDGV